MQFCLNCVVVVVSFQHFSSLTYFFVLLCCCFFVLNSQKLFANHITLDFGWVFVYDMAHTETQYVSINIQFSEFYVINLVRVSTFRCRMSAPHLSVAHSILVQYPLDQSMMRLETHMFNASFKRIYCIMANQHTFFSVSLFCFYSLTSIHCICFVVLFVQLEKCQTYKTNLMFAFYKYRLDGSNDFPFIF